MPVFGLYPGWTAEMLEAHFAFCRWYRRMEHSLYTVIQSTPRLV